MKDERAYLIYILESLEKIRDITSKGRDAFMADEAEHLRAAVLFYLETLGEATQHIPTEQKGQHPEINWAQLTGFRNRIAHGYLDINLSIVWNIIENYLDPLERATKSIMQSLDSDDKTDNSQ